MQPQAKHTEEHAKDERADPNSSTSTHDAGNDNPKPYTATAPAQETWGMRLHARMPQPYLKLGFFTLMWIFVFASFLGLIVEDLFHLALYHNMESRAGLVWGPFSSIYGLGAVLLTLLLNRSGRAHGITIFIVSMLFGTALEFFASLGMEVVFNAIAWDYTGSFGSIDGRTNFAFGFMWGCLGLFWARLALPFMQRVARRINLGSPWYRVVSVLVSAFMVVNIVVTIAALQREGERAEGIAAQDSIDLALDQLFPDEWMQQRFENMTVAEDLSSEKTGIVLPSD